MRSDDRDVQRLRRYLYDLAGCEDDAFVVDMLKAFLESSQESRADFQTALEMNEIARGAHRMKSSFATLGLQDGARACALLEVAAVDEDVSKTRLALHLVEEQRAVGEETVQALLHEMQRSAGREDV